MDLAEVKAWISAPPLDYLDALERFCWLIAEVERLTAENERLKIIHDPCWAFDSTELSMLNIFEREGWYQNTIDTLRKQAAQPKE